MLRAKAISKIPDYRIHAMLWVVDSQKSVDWDLSLIEQHIQPVCNVIPVISKADHCSQKELGECRVSVLKRAGQRGVKLFNCRASAQNTNLNYPFALMNPEDVRKGVAGRESITGVFMDSATSKLDFKTMKTLLFEDLPDDLVTTTDLIM